MLLLMGGLIFWKLKSGEAPKAQDTPPVVPTVAPAALEDAPPPPPPIATADASAAPDQSKSAKHNIVSGGSCGDCSGTPNPAMAGALRTMAGTARACYERALRQNAMLQGHVRLSLKINQSGQVCNASATNELGDPSVANCVLQKFRSSTFPAPTNGCVDAVVPLNFTPKT
jgi:hypothetical protein